MAYNRGYQNRGYQSSGYQNRGYQNSGYQNRGYQRAPKKKSGAKEVQGTTKEGNQYFGISAWFSRKNVGLVQIKAFENSKSTHFTTERGRDGVSLMFEVFYKNSGIKRLEVATYFFDSGKAFLKDLGIIVSTKAPNGGYAGYFQKK
ncbi:hypothetical protein [Capnocytophaga cynodegmi]|uniref:Uncharacterized protein n=1 Tax=Capnocytophaga cynodegmi TaxID=28189 RepID=A0A0B7HI79_9FLAO|nr:hypothetical protein [Capnocytophaga cynodegmi]CEN37612.1 conserved hypothetical protein [Capnocytophaga cynodegmi]